MAIPKKQTSAPKRNRGIRPAPSPPHFTDAEAYGLQNEPELMQYEIQSLQAELSALRSEVEAERFRYRDLFDLNKDAHIITDKIGVILEANFATSAMLGVRPQLLIGKPLAIYVLTSDRRHVRDAISNIPHLGQIDVEVTMTPRELPRRDARLSAAVARDPAGGPESIRWVMRDISEAREAREQLALSREKLRELTSELALAEERVRRDIAVGIHDRVSQPLAMVRILLGKLHQSIGSGESQTIGELQGLVQKAIEESRTLTFELSPPILYELGLISAIEWLAEQTQRRHGLRVIVHNQLDETPLTLDQRIMLFQIVRELVSNIVKHARAKHATISLRHNQQMVELVVSDTGVGIDSTANQRPPENAGFGLFSIRTRVEQIGGEFSVESTPGKGTRVQILMPQKQETPSTLSETPTPESPPP